MAARSIQPDDYVLLTSAGKSQTYLIEDITAEGIYISSLIDSTQKVLLISTPNGWKVQGSVIDYKIEFSHKENPPLIFTEIEDINILILNNLDDDALKSVCQTNKNAEDLCRKDELWGRRTTKYFPGKELEKPADTTWKDYYLRLKRDEGIFYIVSYINLWEKESGILQIHRSLRSAAEAIFEMHVSSNPTMSAGKYVTNEGDLTKNEFIERTMKNEGISIDYRYEYMITSFRERDIKP